MKELLGALLMWAVLWIALDPQRAARELGRMVAEFRAAMGGK